MKKNSARSILSGIQYKKKPTGRKEVEALKEHKQANSPVPYAIALGAPATQLAETIAAGCGTAYTATDMDDLKSQCGSHPASCVVIHLNHPQAVACERLATSWGFHNRILVEIPASRVNEQPCFLLIATSLNELKTSIIAVRNQNCPYWELDRQGESLSEHYRKVLNRVSDGIMRLNSAHEVLFANKVLCDWLGFYDIEGKTYADIFDDDAVQAMNLHEEHLRHGVITTFVVRLRNGQLVALDPTPRFDENGNYDGVLALLHPRDNESAAAQREFHNSRTTMYLTSLSLALNKTYKLEEIIQILIKSIRRLVGDAQLGVLIQGERPVFSPESNETTPQLKAEMADFCERLAPSKNIRVIKDLRTETDPVLETIKRVNAQGAICFALHVSSERLGYVWILLNKKLDSLRERGSMLVSTGFQVGMAVRHALHIRAELREQNERRRFYSDALAAVTGNKLVLCEREELEGYWNECPGKEHRLELREPRDVPESRHLAESLLQSHEVKPDLVFGLVTCVSEAATNVVKYGPPGKMRIKITPQRVWLRFDDCGPGIAVSKLPKAILTSGYSESLTPSLGLGFSLMMKLCTTLRIATGSHGTFLLLEAELQESEVDPLADFVTFQ